MRLLQGEAESGFLQFIYTIFMQIFSVMYYGDAESWNLRDTHMFETLQALLRAIPNSKAIVWAHNSHIGDARATDMGTDRGELNIGQLCREAYGDDAALIGFGTHTGMLIRFFAVTQTIFVQAL